MKTVFLKPFITAPVDIMLMLLGAFIIGFVIAWLLRTMRVRKIEEAAYHLQGEVAQLAKVSDDLEIKNMQLKEQLEECGSSKIDLVSKEELDKALLDLRTERERSMTARSSLMEIESEHEALKKELDIKFNQMISPEEATRLQAEANRLKVFNASLQEEVTLLKAREQPPQTEEETSFPGLMEDDEPSSHLMSNVETTAPEEPQADDKGYNFLNQAGIKAAHADDKDDLKLISGVGPFIEEKLNHLGIYTFEQVASLSDEQVEKVTEAIEFFPGRILRDDWVGQASRFM